MGVRAWLWKVLSKGEPPYQDPDEFVEVGRVARQNGPLTVALLERHGIEATAIAQSRYPGGANFADDVSIRVRFRDAETATGLLRTYV